MNLGPFVADHAVPLSLMIRKVYDDEIYDGKRLVELCTVYSTLVLITGNEDRILNELGLKKNMPDELGW